MRERSIERYLCQQVKAIGGYAMKFVSPGLAGVPDRLVLFKGQASFVELKAPGGRPTARQLAVHRFLEKLGFPVRVLNSTEQVDRFVYELHAWSWRIEEMSLKNQLEKVMQHEVPTPSVPADGDALDS